MNETAIKNNQQVFFDLNALRRELEEMAVKTKSPIIQSGENVGKCKDQCWSSGASSDYDGSGKFIGT